MTSTGSREQKRDTGVCSLSAEDEHSVNVHKRLDGKQLMFPFAVSCERKGVNGCGRPALQWAESNG